MMLRYSFGLEQEATAIEHAVETALAKGPRTQDIAGVNDDVLGTTLMTDRLIQAC